LIENLAKLIAYSSAESGLVTALTVELYIF